MRRKTLSEAITYAGGSEALDTLETVTSLGENVPGVIGRVSRIANVGARIGQTAEKEKRLLELQNELKRRIEAQQAERQAINRKYAPTSPQQVRSQFNFFRFMEDPAKYKQRQKFLRSQGRETDIMEAPVLSQEQTRDLEALAQKYQIPQLMAEIQSLQEDLAADPISTGGITGVVSSVLGGGPMGTSVRHINRGMKGQMAPLAVKVAENIVSNRGNPIGLIGDLTDTASGGNYTPPIEIRSILQLLSGKK